jgi:anti-sigma factor ChrR (cupin superfamily)
MSHTTTDEELTGQAALYALGALDPAEARAFEEHLAEGCETCAAELREFESVAADLGLAAPQAEPPANVRARLLALVSDDEDAGASGETETTTAHDSDLSDDITDDGPNLRRDAAGFLVVRAGEGRWFETEDAGVSYKLLFADRERGTFTTLVRMEAGARIPRHRHLGVEQCLVLEGDLRSGPIEMSAGDFNCSLPGSVHDELQTDKGALLLIVSPKHYEVVAPQSKASA